MTPTGKKFVTYQRVSTKQQGASGLGLEAQQTAVDGFVAREGGKVMASYLEVESGRDNERPQLAKAIAHARRCKATLLVAKLDRLSRNVAFTSALMESGVDFVAVDNPTANRLTIHILAAMAEHEASMISQRTKAALEAAKTRGVKLGSARPGHWKGREGQRLAGLEKARAKAGKAHDDKFREAYGDLIGDVKAQRKAGATLQAIADKLNADGQTTRTGATWTTVQVMRVLKKS